MELLPALAQDITFQDYGAQPEIAGVAISPLRKHRALEGDFMEYCRVTDGEIEGLAQAFVVRQVSLATAVPGRINAFHIHPRGVQDEVWCVVAGSLRVWLVDLRAASPTVGQKTAFLLSEEAPALLFIPAGVAHGYRAGAAGAMLLYAMNAQFDREHPNEGRLPWDHFGPELWGDDRG
jgi:dTDP-4-dehydrorhamnose 3,5-epimerase